MKHQSFGETRRAARLLAGCAAGAIALWSPAAFAQQATAAAQTAPQDETESSDEIVVTGSSIRGVPPTGSQLISLGADEVVNTGAATTQELLASVPQMGTFNTAPRPDPHSGGFLSTAPNIRGLGQAQTLVLVNGHRLVGTGYLQNISDPSIVPPSIVQRVEVVADGTSSVYGSDGLAGVVNVITRRDYDGASGSFRVGYGRDYNLLNTNAVIGTKWDGGGIVASVEYARNSRLQGFDRDFVTTNFSAAGGRDNRATSNCVPSQFQVNAAGGGATGDMITYGSGARNERCDNAGYTDLYPRQERLSFFAAGHQDIAPGAEIYFDAFQSKTSSDANLQPAQASGTITRANPFFPTAQVNALPGGAAINSITAYYNLSNLLGIRLRDVQDISVYGGTLGTNIKLGGNFNWSTYVTGSASTTNLHEGSFNPDANSAALAGTTTATALDPFSGRTSEGVRVGIANFEQYFGAQQWLWELNSKIDGSVVTLPGGDMKIAVGGVYRKEFFDGKNTLTRIGFNENEGRQVSRRTVYSGFGELFIPVFGEANGTTMMQRLDISLSGRYDHYSDFGKTTNPKVGINWAPIKGFTLRGSWGTSFHAPALPDLQGPDTRAGYYSNGGAPAGVAGNFPGNIYIAGGNPNLQPEEATTWSVGFDFTPSGLQGFRASSTFYSVDFKGRIAFPVQFGNFFYQLPEVSRYFIDNIVCAGGVKYPVPYNGVAGCVAQPIPAQVVYDAIKGLRLQNFPQTVNGPGDLPPIHFLQDLRRVNLSRIKTQGIDFDIGYRWSMGDTNVSAQVQGNYITKYDQQAVAGAPFVSQFDYGQVKFKARGQLAATNGGLTGVVAVNYSDTYKSQYVAVSGTTSTNAVEKVDAYTTVDLHLGWDIGRLISIGETELTVDVDNLFDVDPPFIRSGFGYGQGNVLGRVVTLGIRKKF